MRTTRVAVLALVTVTTVAVFAAGGSGGSTVTARHAPPLTVGATGRTSGFAVTVHDTFDGWGLPSSGLVPRSGTRWVALLLSVENVSGRERRWDTALAVSMAGPVAGDYDVINVVDPDGLTVWLRSVRLAAGGVASGLVLFEVPGDADRLRLWVRGSSSAVGVRFDVGGGR